MSNVMPNMRSTHIEDWRINGPDEFNSFSSSGDPENDWWPTIMRAQTAGLGLNEASGVPYQLNPPTNIYFGATREIYPVRRTVNIYSSLIGLRRGVELRFGGPLVEDGLVAHYPDTPAVGGGFQTGTFHPANDYAIGPGMAPWEGYGTNPSVRIENMTLRFQSDVSVNARGMAIYRRIRVRDCTVLSAPWHGIHVVADVLRGFVSNGNGTTIDDTELFSCGRVYGTKAYLVAPGINDDGFRGFGWGICFQGGDSNWCRVKSCDATSCGRGGCHERSFLGPNIIDHLHSEQISEPFLRTQVEADREASAAAWLAANPADGALALSDPEEWERLNAIATETFLSCRGWGRPVGSINYWAAVADGPSSRSTISNTYVESDGIVRVDAGNIAIGGIVANDEGSGMRVGVNESSIKGTWRAYHRAGVYPRLTFGVSDTIPLSLDGPLGSMFLESGANGFIRCAYNGADIRNAIQVALQAGLIYMGREIDVGRLLTGQAMYFGSTRFNIANANPALTPPSSTGAFWAHNNGPGDQVGDLVIWPQGPKTPGSPWLWVCQLVGEALAWVPVLVMP